ncbi:glycosyltransferase [Ornithinimicrobium sp. W1665]
MRSVDLEGAEGRLWALRPQKTLPRRVDPAGDRRRARTVVRTAQRLDLRDPVLWVNDPGGWEVLAASGWPALYDITDDWLVADRPEPELARLRRQETSLFADCREVVVCSEGLVRTKSQHRDVVLIPNAVDVEPYRSRQPRPADVGEGPVALYLGTAHRDRVDVGLLVRTALHLGRAVDGTVVLVGPAPLPRDDLARLQAAGVRVLGHRPSSTVPAYLQHADVLIVPHVLTDFTASLDPIKAYEYRAARRPVVSTRVPGFEDSTDPLVTTVETDNFPEAVAAAMVRPAPWSPEIPQDIPTWSQRVVEMADVIARVRAGHP